ncbi:MAG: hypothetical protein ACRDOB_02360, partial [Streptosporangiaceae bacterium]
MLTGAAVCPNPPLLIPEAAGAPGPGDAELQRLRAACHQVVADLLSERPDLVAVVGGAEHTAEYPPDAPGSLRTFGVPFTVGGPDPCDAPGAPVLPLALTVGKWLLSRAASPAPAVWWGIASDTPAAGCLDLGERLAALAPRVALLVLGDGPGPRARG